MIYIYWILNLEGVALAIFKRLTSFSEAQVIIELVINRWYLILTLYTLLLIINIIIM